MSILSLDFLVFFAAVLIVYYIFPLKIRWVALLAASLVFVALSGWQSAAHLSIVALTVWAGGLGLQALRGVRMRKLLLTLLLMLDLGAMMLIKYQPVFSDWFGFSVWEMGVPLGLSYFTFQSVGYLIDVYRGKVQAQHNPLRVWLFAGYFPQLSQGPISTWKELGHQLLEGHRFEPEQFVSGFQLLLWGYFKKLVIADRLAATTSALLTENNALPGWFVLGGVVLFAIRLYMDFSGGMDVVRGLSRMLGIELPENFRRPFFSRSVAEYWRRWHITLGAWFRSYLLYPLTTSSASLALSKGASKALGKRVGLALPSALATFLVFVFIGIWHTANENALVFGAYFGVVMATSMLLDPVWKAMRRRLKLPKGGWMTVVRLVRTWLLILLAQFFAFTNSAAQGFSLLRQSFSTWDFSAFSEKMTSVMPLLEWGIAGAGLLVALVVDLLCERKKDMDARFLNAGILVRWPLLLMLLLSILVFGIYGSGYDAQAFLYTQF